MSHAKISQTHRDLLLATSYLQAVRMIADHTHELGKLAIPPKFAANHSMHTRVAFGRIFGTHPCSCGMCTTLKRRIIVAGGTAAVRDLFAHNLHEVDPIDFVLDKFRKGETNAKLA